MTCSVSIVQVFNTVICIGLPYNIVCNAEFKELLAVATGGAATGLPRTEHNECVEVEFMRFCNQTALDMKAAHTLVYQSPFLSHFTTSTWTTAASS